MATTTKVEQWEVRAGELFGRDGETVTSYGDERSAVWAAMDLLEANGGTWREAALEAQRRRWEDLTRFVELMRVD